MLIVSDSLSTSKIHRRREASVRSMNNRDIPTLKLAQRTAIAGALAGMFSFFVLHPLDTIKTVRQSSPGSTSGILATAAYIVQTRGWAALYAGVIPAALGSAPSSALYFATYESTKAFLFSRTTARSSVGEQGTVDYVRSRVPIHLTAAACGNIASSVLFVPKEVVKQRLQSGYARNAFAVAVKLRREHGVSALYRGFRATLLRNIPSNALKFVIYEEIKRGLQARRSSAHHSNSQPPRNRRRNLKDSYCNGGVVGKELTGAEHWIAGAVSGVISSAVTTPMDVLKTRLATQDSTRAGRRSLVGLAKKILREEGVLGLYVGFRSRVLLAALFSAVGLGSYELFRKQLVPHGATIKQTQASRLRSCSVQAMRI